MKNHLVVISIAVFSFCISSLSAQSDNLLQNVRKSIKPTNCDPRAALLVNALNENHPADKLKENFDLIMYDDEPAISALIKITDAFDQTDLTKYRVQVNTVAGQIFSIHIPISQFRQFIQVPGLAYLELDKMIFPKLDKALIASRIDLVHEGENLPQALSGRGVVVGIIDFGFDYTHPTFSNSTSGQYRIARVWEQNTLGGTPPIGFSYGHELSGEQIIKSAETDIPLTGHGTHVASIAAGSGGNMADKFRGVAYESDIVLVSLNAREGVNGNNTGVIDGINYIFRYAESMGKPAVINLSQGHHNGPHDGTSLADQAMDAMVGPGKIIVGAVGNEGDASGFYLHFDHQFDQEHNISSYLVWPDDISSGTTLVDIWGEAGKDFQVGIQIYNPRTKMKEAAGEFLTSEDPVSFVNGILIDREGDTLYYEGGIEINPLNNRPHAQLYIDNTGQKKGGDVNLADLLDNDFVLLNFQADQGILHAYAANNSGDAFFTDLSGIGAEETIENVRIKGGNERSTMGELGGTGKSIISVGGYTTKNSFINTSGQLMTIDNIIGDQYFRSSQGPTHDGRIKPEISAPANLIAAAENSFYSEADILTEVAKIEKGNGSHWSYSIRRGTSSAAPLVAGIVALMLELNPELTPEDAKNLLTSYGEQDNFTGLVPNNIWGYGKVNAFDAISILAQSTSTTKEYALPKFNVFPNPSYGRITISSPSKGTVNMRLVNTAGKTIHDEKIALMTGENSVQLPSQTSGIYFIQIIDNHHIFSEKLIILH